MKLKNLSFGYRTASILKDITFNVSKGEFISIIGPNGTGKSTLLRLLSGFLHPSFGSVKFMGKRLESYKPLDLARVRAFVSQDNFVNFPYTAREVVMMGRFPFMGDFQGEKKEDLDKVLLAMEVTSTAGIADRPVTELSGGERQRVYDSPGSFSGPSGCFT